MRFTVIKDKYFTPLLDLKRIRVFLLIILFALVFGNVLFLIIGPFFLIYFGLFTFFFVYGLHVATEFPDLVIKSEMVWFANGFSMVPMQEFEDTTLLFKGLVHLNWALEGLFVANYFKQHPDLLTGDQTSYLARELYLMMPLMDKERVFPFVVNLIYSH